MTQEWVVPGGVWFLHPILAMGPEGRRVVVLVPLLDEGWKPNQIYSQVLVDGQVKWAALRGARLEVWPVGGEAPLWQVELGMLRSMGFSPDGEWLVTITDEGELTLWEAETGQRRGEVIIPQHLNWFTFGPGPDRISVGTMDKVIRSLGLPDLRPVGELEFAERTWPPVEASPTGSLLALLEDEYTLILLDPTSGQVLHRWTTFPEPVGQVVFCPSGELVAAATRAGTVWLWQVAEGEELGRLDVAGTLPPGGLLYLSLAFWGEEELLVTVSQRLRLEAGLRAWFTNSQGRVLACRLPVPEGAP